MKRAMIVVVGLVMTAGLSGCVTASTWGSEMSLVTSGAGGHVEESRPDRQVVWKARLRVEVWSISNAVSQATAVAEEAGGFVEQSSGYEDELANLTLRIPAQAFRAALSDLEALGTLTYRNVEGEDITEQYIDMEARLKNKTVLRDRLKQLLEKASEIKDLLAIETELSRVQADIDSLEGRIKSLKGQVEYATVKLSLHRKPIPGPLGYLLKGLWWGVEKLFVIRK